MHKKFSYKNLHDLQSHIDTLGIDLGYTEDLRILATPVSIDGHVVPNGLVAHPMEGGDSDDVGGPTDLTFKKYERVAEGGAGLIWLEAVSVNQEGRSNKRQLYINDDSLPGFRDLAKRIYSKAAPQKPITIMQLNHSGRYSKPYGKSAPIIASRIAELDKRFNLPDDYPLVADNYLDGLVDDFVNAALLAKKAGFDGVDIKACHGYLLHELLSCFDRDGKYGGSFENRTRLMLDIVDAVRSAVNDPDFIIASRINIFDALPETLGWGQARVVSDGADCVSADFSVVDLTEPIKLAQELVKRGVKLISATMGNPYHIPHVNRPYDTGHYYPNEDPLEGVFRLIHYTSEMQKAVPEAKLVGAGYSWLREFSPYVAAWVMGNNGASLVGYGRLFIAYPDFARDILESGKLKRNKVCVTCSKCSMMKREIGTCGCVLRDTASYLEMYKEMQSRGAAGS